jgi:AcrR family transcriptional regulator
MTTTFNNIPEEKQMKIITEAMKLFAEYGYEVASTNILTKRLAISKGSLFKYFQSKLGLYVYLVSYASTNLTTYINKNIEYSFSNWRDMIINYAAVEYDFLIKYPTEFNFLRVVVKDMNVVKLSSVQSLLEGVSKSFAINIFDGYDLNNIEIQHINFVIQGYKSYYMKTNEVKPGQKTIYLDGLNNHLKMIKTGENHDY